MRVHRITVQDVKGIRQRTVDFPTSGVVVVEGPNEVGKSTILEAFDKLLDPRLKSTSVREEIRALKPVGRDVGPYVQAEFTVGGHRVRYAKRWLRQPITTLEVISPVPEQLSGEAAAARVDRLIGESLDRTLWDALRFTQAQDGTVAPLADSAVLSSALDAAAGSQLHTEGGDRVLDRVAQEYSLYFTRTGRPTGDYKAALTAYTSVQDAVSEAHRRLQEAEELLQRQQAARCAVDRARAELEAAQVELGRAHQAQEAVAEVVASHERARARLGTASEKARTATRARQQRRELIHELRALTEKVSRAQEHLRADEEAASSLTEPQRVAEEVVTATEGDVERAEEGWEGARADAEQLTAAASLADVEDLVARVTQLVAQLDEARRAGEGDEGTSGSRRPVPPRIVREVRELQSRVEVLQARHEVASGRLRVESLGAPVEVAITEPTDDAVHRSASYQERSRVESGARQTFVVTEQTTVTVEGAVRVVVVPEESSQARATELAQARLQLERALVENGVQNLEELEEYVEEQQRRSQRLRELTRELEITTAARSVEEQREAMAGRVPTGLLREVAHRRSQLEDAAASRDQQHPLPADESAAAAAVQASTQALHEARAARRAALTALAEHRERSQALRAKLDRDRGRLEADRERSAALSAALERARTQVADEVLEAQVEERSAVLAAVELEVEQASRALEQADVDGIGRRVVAAAQRVEHTGAEQVRLTAALHTLNGQVEMAASEGRAELYDHAVAALEEAERHLASLDRRARAARHLWRTLQAHRDAAHRAYVRPYAEALEQLGRAVYGPGFKVSVDDRLTLAARTLDGTTVPFEQLSGGAKEQLGILARLAVARLVDPAQGVPVVIDDALGYSDPARLRQMGEVLGASARGADVQVILLTCTPERYAAIPHATTVRLSA